MSGAHRRIVASPVSKVPPEGSFQTARNSPGGLRFRRPRPYRQHGGSDERPKGSAVTADGRYAVISGGPRTTFEPSGVVYVIDLRTRTVVGTVTGVGNDPYGLAVTRQ